MRGALPNRVGGVTQIGICRLFPLLSPGIHQKMVPLCVRPSPPGSPSWLILKLHEEGILVGSQQHGEAVTRIVLQVLALGVVGPDYHAIHLFLDAINLARDSDMPGPEQQGAATSRNRTPQ